MDGFIVLEQYGKKYPDAILIILTSHTEMSRKGYHVNAFRFIDKQALDEIEEALASAEKKFLQGEKIPIHVVNAGILWISYRDMIYLESNGRKTKVHTRKGEMLASEGIEELAKKVKNHGFSRVHRAYIVNMEYIDKLGRTEVFLTNGEKVYMSRRKVTNFKMKYLEWKFAKGNG